MNSITKIIRLYIVGYADYNLVSTVYDSDGCPIIIRPG